MKTIRSLQERLILSIRNYLMGAVEQPIHPEPTQTRNEGLARLHDYQNQIILGLFRTSIAGLAAFLLIVLSFTLFMFTDPMAPAWVGLMMGAVGALVLLGCYKTVREYRFYKKNYAELMGQLHSRVRQYLHRTSGESKGGGSFGEPRVLAVLKPKEHVGWDAKPCQKCKKTIELLSAVCQHCGQEQDDTLIN